MALDLTTALTWAGERKLGVLITLRRDGRSQSSDITYIVKDGAFVISLTDGRAKTKNMRRDDRVVLHVTDGASWSYVSFDATVALSPVAASIDDATVETLVDYYRTVAGEHDNWDEYRAAMVADQRLIATVTPTAAVGQIH